MKTISELAKELFITSPRPADVTEAVFCLSKALDEWQATVEARLTEKQAEVGMSSQEHDVWLTVYNATHEAKLHAPATTMALRDNSAPSNPAADAANAALEAYRKACALLVGRT